MHCCKEKQCIIGIGFLAVFLLNAAAGFEVELDDQTKKYYLTSQMQFSCELKPQDEGSDPVEVLRVENGTWQITRNFSVNATEGNQVVHMYEGKVGSRGLRLNMKAAKTGSGDDKTSHVDEFYLFFNLNGTAGFNDSEIQVVVEPPRFTHFQVKTGWQYSCPDGHPMKLQLCVPDSQLLCSKAAPFDRLSCQLVQQNVTFGESRIPKDENKVEQCPVSYETRPDVGIACIATFWGIVVAIAAIFIGKFLIKRMRAKDY